MNDKIPNVKKKLICILDAAWRARASFGTLFQQPCDGVMQVWRHDRKDLLKTYKSVLDALCSELDELLSGGGIAGRSSRCTGNVPDSVDYLNHLVAMSQGVPLSEILSAGILDIMTAGSLFEPEGLDSIHKDKFLEYQFDHGCVLCDMGISAVRDYFNILSLMGSKHGKLSRIRPEAADFLAVGPLFSTGQKSDGGKILQALRDKAREIDSFKDGRVFRYSEGMFIPAVLSPIRPVGKFYGYRDARDLFFRHFSDFASRGDNLPLLISSLPGLGKTHMTISHALHFESLTLVLPEASELSRPLSRLMDMLAAKKNRRFVIFFDDIDTRKVDWYFFRSHVGGSFLLPDNIAIVIASNYEFPANIASRGRGFTFHIFDEIECQKMVEDFLIEKGMRSPPPALVSVIAADYVEDFGQKKFGELSPRTLVRYLDIYNKDSKKRMRMLELSREELIAKPDSTCFYEANKLVNEMLRKSI
ncbi:MAG: hypothetical protein JW808_03720 [Victivallales bacterium]|nr:hypothetical protein [Victivallales bacterium]